MECLSRDELKMREWWNFKLVVAGGRLIGRRLGDEDPIVKNTQRESEE